MVDLEPLEDAEDIELVRSAASSGTSSTPAATLGARILDDWTRLGGDVREGDAARLQARAATRRRERPAARP